MKDLKEDYIEGLFFFNEKGTTMLETSVVLPVFLLIILASFEFLRLGFVSASTQFLANEGIRMAVVCLETENCDPSVRAERVRQQLINRANTLGITLRAEDICFQRQGDGTDSCRSEAGQGRELIGIKLSQNIPLLLFGGRQEFAVSGFAVGRNEAF